MGKTRKIQKVRPGKVKEIDKRDQDRKNKRIRVQWHIGQGARIEQRRERE